ncbi:MAG: phenylalanine--tRNA ligase subunit beta, partial [Patescibacteria group bacterium]|nr:phenylalanine--tRNA ligase subunit beta [Patescibacteria group bacterium]
MLVNYKWLKSYVPELPENLSDIFTNHICELEGVENNIYELSILPDRAHDLLSHQGVAKELASLLNLEFKVPEYKKPESVKTNLKIKIETDKCNRYMGRVVKGVKVESSPDWIVEYLESIGQKSINNIVDATNIVLFDLGQPIHVFDLDKLEDESIYIRSAKDGERIELLEEKEGEQRNTELEKNNILITDQKDPIALAGVKGGLKAKVDKNTTNILIEVANFNSTSIRKTARKFGIQTDASKRYENGMSANLCQLAMEEISALIFEMNSTATFENIVDEYPNKAGVRKVSFSTKYISKVLGVNLNDNDVQQILDNYGYKYTGNWEVEVPDLRLDITGPHDMAEEIGRIYGYDKIESKLPEFKSELKDDKVWNKIVAVKNKLIEDGYFEVETYTFTNKGDIEILASASDKNFLRTNLTDGIKDSLAFNSSLLPILGLKDLNELKIFEVGTVFPKKGEEINVCYGDNKEIKEVKLDEFVTDNNLDLIYPKKYNEFKMWSLYPFIKRDIAVWVPEKTDSTELIKLYQELGTDLLVMEPKLFDSFSKKGKTSYAFRLVFQSDEKTLTDEEVNSIMDKINEKITALDW